MTRKSNSPVVRTLDAEAEAELQEREFYWRERLEQLASVVGSARTPVSIEQLAARLAKVGFAGEGQADFNGPETAIDRAIRLHGECKQRRAEIARLNGLGMNDSQIAAAIGMSRPHVCRLRGELGIPPVKRQRNG